MAWNVYQGLHSCAHMVEMVRFIPRDCDPDTNTGWYDSSGFENGDECAYIFGQTHGQPGRLYNQVIGGFRFLTQEEFSNRDFNITGGGCVQSASAEAH